MKNLILFLALIICASFTVTIQAQVLQNANEMKHNRADIRKNIAAGERDKAELKDFKYQITRFEAAFKERDLKSVQELKTVLQRGMTREILQSQRKAVNTRQEVQQSKVEVRSESRELRHDRRDAAVTRKDRHDDQKDILRDRLNKADDRKDLKDDKKDHVNQTTRLQEQKRMLATWKAHEFSFEGTNLEKSIAIKKLLNRFVETMEADLKATATEMREDVQEIREDRKERRDDRNERREGNN